VYEGDTLLYRVSKFGFFKVGFNVTDYHNELKFSIKHTFSFGGLKFSITDHNENQIAFVAQKLSITSQKMEIESIIGPLLLKGNFRSSEYTIFRNEEELAKDSRNFFDSKNFIVLGVRDDVRQDVIIGITLSIILKLQLQSS